MSIMAAATNWRGRAPTWLRILAGVLVFPPIVVLLAAALSTFSDIPRVALPFLAIVAGGVSWALVRRSSTRVAAGLSVLAVLGLGLAGFWFLTLQAPSPSADDRGGGLPDAPPPLSAAPGQAPSPSVLPVPPPLPPAPAPQPSVLLPEFPWPPPAASASYVLPDNLFEGRRTVGDVAGAIVAALERAGYVERSFFRTKDSGVALVTRLERIKDDGTSFGGSNRWPPSKQSADTSADLLGFLLGLFFVDPGRYRVIVFVLQDLPFSQSSQSITGEDARAWLRTGANVLPPEVAGRPFGGGHCTALVYEFASDGSAVRVVESRLTGKEHLEKAGVSLAAGKAN
jgi:hypothetical protein